MARLVPERGAAAAVLRHQGLHRPPPRTWPARSSTGSPLCTTWCVRGLQIAHACCSTATWSTGCCFPPSVPTWQQLGTRWNSDNPCLTRAVLRHHMPASAHHKALPPSTALVLRYVCCAALCLPQDAGLNCRGVHVTDPRITALLGRRTERVPLSVSVHGTPRQWGESEPAGTW